MKRLRHLPVALLLASLAGAAAPVPLAAMAVTAQPTDARPNIVVFLLDDTAVHDGRLWSDPALTPNLYDAFVAHGVHFANAIGDTPLCCPARATLLTGLHSHNHGVKENDVRLFHPDGTLPVRLVGSGYQTMLLGKYMNRPEHLVGDLWAQHAAGWSVFDIFTSAYDAEAGNFVGYTVTTKDGSVLAPAEHSTRWIADQAVSSIAATDPSRPIFALLSLAATHLPNIPMPEFASDPRCDAMPPWDPPNYNEGDLSDKPPWVADQPLWPYPDGWPMVAYCREMLGVDWMVGRVMDQLRADGRLDNTLLVFTSDNGMSWGAHRLSLKETPYSTPVPLYMSWPARWGSAPRTVNEYVSNIDLAPTFCALAGCTLGPFATGQDRADGLNLLPLLDGTVSELPRDALLETEWRTHRWVGLRTTNHNRLGLWHYVEWEPTFFELYDSDADPWELRNLAYNPAYASIRGALHERLQELLAEGRPTGSATLTIVQDTLPDDAQDFSFKGDLGDFVLDDDGGAGVPRSRTFTGLAPGSYLVEQKQLPRWSLASLTCTAANSGDPSSRHAYVNLLPGEHAVCVFSSARRQVDASVALAGVGIFKGDNVYSRSAVRRQTLSVTRAVPGQTYEFLVRLQNDSLALDSFRIKAQLAGAHGSALTFLVGGVDVTAAVIAGQYETGDVVAGNAATMVVQATLPIGSPSGTSLKITIRQTSLGDSSRRDVVRAILSV